MSRHRTENGQGLVEFAVIFPIFAVILFMILDGALVMGRYNNINNSAKEAARLGAVGANVNEIVTRAKDQAHGYLNSVPAGGNCSGLGSSSVDDVICVEWISGPNGESPGQAGSSVRVTIEHEYDFLTPITNVFGVGGWTIEVCAVQRLERATSPPAANRVPGEDSCDD
jgi:hypothetical protein